MAACSSCMKVRNKVTGLWQSVSCGRCLPCRMNHARDWATRLVHESQLHEESSFLTLTYSDDQLPDPPSVSRRAMQLFMGRLRDRLAPTRVRFFACGEYGTKTQRPHYHVLLFGYAFREDRRLWSEIRGNLYYRSPMLESLWPYGMSNISDVTIASAGYVARYSVKKANDFTASAGKPYERFVPLAEDSFYFTAVEPEFIQMSTKPGIGFGWFDKYQSDMLPSGFTVVNGRKRPIPRAYKRRVQAYPELYPSETHEGLDELSNDQLLRNTSPRARADSTCERVTTKAELLRLRTLTLTRDLE